MKNQPKNTICLWYEKDAQAAAEFYAATFPDSKVGKVTYAPSDFPDGKKGDPLMVEFTVTGIPCMGLNGGPTFKQSEAFSFSIITEDQAETDKYRNAIVGNGGQESQCGWCKDKWGVSWQITPRVLDSSYGSWWCRGQTCIRCDDENEKNRRCHNRSGTAWSRLTNW